ncbi:unnamed protein product, partial [Rotaria sordida]
LYGNATNLLFWSSGIAYDLHTGDLYVENPANQRVMKYSYGALNGTIFAQNNE